MSPDQVDDSGRNVEHAGLVPVAIGGNAVDSPLDRDRTCRYPLRPGQPHPPPGACARWRQLALQLGSEAGDAGDIPELADDPAPGVARDLQLRGKEVGSAFHLRDGDPAAVEGWITCKPATGAQLFQQQSVIRGDVLRRKRLALPHGHWGRAGRRRAAAGELDQGSVHTLDAVQGDRLDQGIPRQIGKAIRRQHDGHEAQARLGLDDPAAQADHQAGNQRRAVSCDDHRRAHGRVTVRARGRELRRIRLRQRGRGARAGAGAPDQRPQTYPGRRSARHHQRLVSCTDTKRPMGSALAGSKLNCPPPVKLGLWTNGGCSSKTFRTETLRRTPQKCSGA